MFIQIKYYFASNLRFPGSSHVGLSTKSKNKLACDVGYSILLPHMTDLFVVTSLIQTVHKTKALTVEFSRISNVIKQIIVMLKKD